jgi:hypothetical protein
MFSALTTNIVKNGTVAGNERKKLEKKLGDSVINPLNAKGLVHRSKNELSKQEE